jgi:ABC-type transport system involved in multi-copper enzyme maturation permease subunit
MFGPVFTLELMRERRRGFYWRLLPWAYAVFLAVQTLVTWPGGSLTDRSRGPVLTPAAVFPSQVERSVVQHFLLLFLLTPALTASALGEEKAKGTLADLFTTSLTSAEILGGKLMVHSLRAAEIVLPSLPILVVVGGYSGIPLSAFAALLLMSLLVVLGVGALGLLCAVASKHSSGALLRAYTLVGIGVFMVRTIPLPALDPLETLTAALGHIAPWATARHLGAAALAWLAVAGIFFAGAVWRLRPDGLRQMHGSGAKVSARPPHRPPVGDDPIRWREYHIEGLAPLPMFRRVARPWGVLAVGVAATGITTYSASLSADRFSQFYGEPLPFILQGLLFLFVATLIVTVRSAGAVTAERERDTWESLRLTPLDGRRFLNGKLRGIFDSIFLYYIIYALPAVVLSLPGGPAGGSFAPLATIASLVIAWPLMYYAACCGLRTSAQARSTWRSLLAAILSVYMTSVFLCFAISISAGVAFTILAITASSLVGPTGGDAVRVFAAFIVPIGCALALVAIGRSHLRLAEARALNPPKGMTVSVSLAARREGEGSRG